MSALKRQLVIDQELFNKIRNASGLSTSELYRRISERALRDNLSPHLASLSVARDAGVGINEFASSTDLAALRGPQSSSRSTPPRVPNGKRAAKKVAYGKGSSVWVLHGQNEKLRKALFDFLEAAGVHPTNQAQAVVVLLPPD